MSTNLELNNYLETYNITEDDYNSITPSNTVNLVGTIIAYSEDIKSLLCSSCYIKVEPSTLIEHLEEKHRVLYNTYLEVNNTLNLLIAVVDRLPIATTRRVKRLLVPNTLYFKELLLLPDGLKCRECSYTHLRRRKIIKHYRRVHKPYRDPITGERTRPEEYIITNVPLQLLETEDEGTRVYFIPKLPV